MLFCLKKERNGIGGCKGVWEWKLGMVHHSSQRAGLVDTLCVKRCSQCCSSAFCSASNRCSLKGRIVHKCQPQIDQNIRCKGNVTPQQHCLVSKQPRGRPDPNALHGMCFCTPGLCDGKHVCSRDVCKEHTPSKRQALSHRLVLQLTSTPDGRLWLQL